MNTPPTSPGDISAPWTIWEMSEEIAIVDAYGEPVAVCLRVNIIDERVVKARLTLAADAPELLRLARSAACAFGEHLDCLREALKDTCDEEDIEDQIGNYEHLLAEHRAVLDKLDGR